MCNKARLPAGLTCRSVYHTSLLTQSKALRSAELDLKKLTNRLKQFTEERRHAQRAVDSMLSKYPWIAEEKAFFGRRQTDYDFEARDPEVAQANLKSLREEQASLSKKVTITNRCVECDPCLLEKGVLYLYRMHE